MSTQPHRKSPPIVKQLAHRFLAAMKDHGAFWWTASAATTGVGLMRSGRSGKPYRGVNQVLLLHLRHQNGDASCRSPWWFTLHHINKLNFRVARGCRAGQILGWDRREAVVRPPASVRTATAGTSATVAAKEDPNESFEERLARQMRDKLAKRDKSEIVTMMTFTSQELAAIARDTADPGSKSPEAPMTQAGTTESKEGEPEAANSDHTPEHALSHGRAGEAELADAEEDDSLSPAERAFQAEAVKVGLDRSVRTPGDGAPRPVFVPQSYTVFQMEQVEGGDSLALLEPDADTGVSLEEHPPVVGRDAGHVARLYLLSEDPGVKELPEDLSTGEALHAAARHAIERLHDQGKIRYPNQPALKEMAIDLAASLLLAELGGEVDMDEILAAQPDLETVETWQRLLDADPFVVLQLCSAAELARGVISTSLDLEASAQLSSATAQKEASNRALSASHDVVAPPPPPAPVPEEQAAAVAEMSP